MNSRPHSARRGRRAATVLATTAAAALLAFGTAAPAGADTGAQGKYVGNEASGHKVRADGGGEIGTSLFKLQLKDGSTLLTYCIDYETRIRSGADYVEDQWANYPGKGEFSAPGKVHWVLQNSYPTVDVAALAAKSKVRGLDQKSALAGTQAAIWHFSNGKKFSERGNNPKVIALYDYLVKNAQDLASEEPHASLAIDPTQAEGKAGETIGKFTVTTSGKDLDFALEAPEGVELVDVKTGKPATKVNNGDQLGVKVPEGTAPGKASLSADVESTVGAGRLFKGVKGQRETQTLITAQTKSTKVTAGAEVTWTAGEKPSPSPSPSTPDEKPTPSPSPSTPDEKPSPSESPSTPPAAEKPDDKPGLPVTGTALGGLIAAAAVALGGGGTAMYLARKRRNGAGAAE
ncbi:TQXA domain-containing protein [Murinocardiopsis flavida]|uniref:TQXA domain-containing protein n=1 Tax=Murinocardiopsis flavida TaxID=645275 RepID=A0A2P8DJX5_9ACTN|nr:thioester domain-containing protein [Murinocardiopsis flavida]PSK97498.1 TQXA domain-containing protein [Murinocardiopsis flavida]